MGVPYKIMDYRNNQRFGVVVSSLRELTAKAQEKFSIRAPVKVLLESDGTLIDNEEYFSSRQPDTCFVILKPNEKYEVPSSGNTSEKVSKKAKSGNKNAVLASVTSSNAVLIPVESPFSSVSSLHLPAFRKVFSRVLKCLSLEDRNSIRLTCRLWNDICCNDPHVYLNEKLVFRPFDDIAYIASCLQESKRKFLNVEFHLEKLNLIPNQVWKICGPKLLSIIWHEGMDLDNDSDDDDNFDDDDSNDEDSDIDEYYANREGWKTTCLLDIIRYCTRLEYFSRQFEYWSMEKIVTESVLDELLCEKIVRDNMKGLSESFTFADLENAKKFKVFPKLTDVMVSDSMASGKKTNISLSTLPNTVTKLKLIPSLPCSSNCLTSLNSRVMLSELLISIEGKLDVDCSLLPFFTRQTGLEVVRLHISKIYVSHEKMGSGAFYFPKEVELFKAKLVVHILDSCPKLKVLDIVFTDSKELIADTDQQDRRFSQMFGERISKLECLSLANFDFTKLLPPVLPERSNLKRLQFPETDSSCIRVLKEAMFCSLQFIDLPKCNLAMLKTISECLVSLRALRIEHLSEGQHRPNKKTQNGLIERLKTIPNVSFEKLEHLEVYGGSYSMLLVFNQFHFPILKHFMVSDYKKKDWFCEASINKIIDCLPQRTPNLEMVHFNVCTDLWIKGSSDVEFLRRMPKLQVFAFGTKKLMNQGLTFWDMADMFEMCPSLRLIIHRVMVFFYDRISRKAIGRILSSGRAFEKTCYEFKEGTCCKFLPSRKYDESKIGERKRSSPFDDLCL